MKISDAHGTTDAYGNVREVPPGMAFEMPPKELKKHTEWLIANGAPITDLPEKKAVRRSWEWHARALRGNKNTWAAISLAENTPSMAASIRSGRIAAFREGEFEASATRNYGWPVTYRIHARCVSITGLPQESDNPHDPETLAEFAAEKMWKEHYLPKLRRQVESGMYSNDAELGRTPGERFNDEEDEVEW